MGSVLGLAPCLHKQLLLQPYRSSGQYGDASPSRRTHRKYTTLELAFYCSSTYRQEKLVIITVTSFIFQAHTVELRLQCSLCLLLLLVLQQLQACCQLTRPCSRLPLCPSCRYVPAL